LTRRNGIFILLLYPNGTVMLGKFPIEGKLEQEINPNVDSPFGKQQGAARLLKLIILLSCNHFCRRYHSRHTIIYFAM
jgi:hypothetical protein